MRYDLRQKYCQTLCTRRSAVCMHFRYVFGLCDFLILGKSLNHFELLLSILCDPLEFCDALLD
jgi:hypothetical protein